MIQPARRAAPLMLDVKPLAGYTLARQNETKVKKISKTILKMLFIAGALLFVVLYFIPSSVLLRLKDRSAVDPADGLVVIFNPMRNRQPENSASSFLQLLKDGKCQDAVSELPDRSSPNEYICGKEDEHRLTDWKLVDRNDEPGKTVLHYKAYRADYPDNHYGNIWITVVRQAGDWKVLNFEAWY